MPGTVGCVLLNLANVEVRLEFQPGDVVLPVEPFLQLTHRCNNLRMVVVWRGLLCTISVLKVCLAPRPAVKRASMLAARLFDGSG